MRRFTFFAPIILQGAASLLAIPILIWRFGPDVWAEIAFGQSVGGYLTLLALGGYDINGVTRLYQSTDRVRVLHESLRVRAILLGLVSMILIALSFSDRTSLVWPSAMVTVTTALTFNWAFVAQNRSLALVLSDIAPRVASALGGLAMVAAGSPPWVYLSCLGAGSVLAGVVGYLAARPPYQGITMSPPSARSTRIVRALLIQLPAAGSSVMNGLTLYGPVLLIVALYPSSAATLILVDRLRAQLVALGAPISNVVLATLKDFRDLSEYSHRGLRWLLGAAVLTPAIALPVFISGVQILTNDAIALRFHQALVASAVVGVSLLSFVLPATLIAPAGRIASLPIIHLGSFCLFALVSYLFADIADGIEVYLLASLAFYSAIVAAMVATLRRALNSSDGPRLVGGSPTSLGPFP